MSDCLREYHPAELGKDGYPVLWHLEIKQLIRELAEHRCLRCRHPYPPDIAATHPRGEWTPCDERCDHGGQVRFLVIIEGEGSESAEWWETVALQSVGPMIEQGQPYEAKWRVLTVHHLDGAKANCRWWNLVPLCQRCHLQIQNKVKMNQLYPFEHSDWFKPYAAGYYAFHYLEQDLTREETDARLDELLALELA